MPSDKVKKILQRFSQATIKAAMADRPEIMQASGFDYDKDGNVYQGDPTATGPSSLAKNLKEIALAPLVDTGVGVAGAAIAGTKLYKATKLAREINKAVKSAGKSANTAKDVIPKHAEIPVPSELPVSSSDASITRIPSYSGSVHIEPSKAGRAFVDDVREALEWESKRGVAAVPKSDELSLGYYRDRGREAYIYSHPTDDGLVLKELHHYAVPGENIYPIPEFDNPDDAVRFATEYVKDRNLRPYNLVENVEGVTKNSTGNYAPVLSQKKVVPADKVLNKTWEEVDNDISNLGYRIGDRHYTSNIRAKADKQYIPEAGRKPTNNIIYENDFQKVVIDPKTGKAYIDPDTGKVFFETKDLRKDNVGYLPDGSLIGFDLFKNGGLLHTYEDGGPKKGSGIIDESDPDFVGPPTPNKIKARNNMLSFYKDVFTTQADKYRDKYPNYAYYLEKAGELYGDRMGVNEASFIGHDDPNDIITLTGTKSSNVPVSKSVLDSLALNGAKAGVSPSVALGLANQESRFGYYPTASYNSQDMRAHREMYPEGYAMNQGGNTPIEIMNDAAYGNNPYMNTLSYLAKKYGVGYFFNDSVQLPNPELSDEMLLKLENELAKDRNYADRQAKKLGEPGSIFRHAFELYKNGQYNQGDPNHSADVEMAGEDAFSSPEIQQWWNSVGRKYYEQYAPSLLKDFKSGGKIHIKESKKGTFTAAAKKHGKSVQAFASQVLANKSKYSPAIVKKANFARNAAKWHADGGSLHNAIADGKFDVIRAAINEVKNRKI